MSRDYIVGIELTSREGFERRLDVTPDWQVWVDDEEHKNNLGPLSAVMLAGVIAEIDTVVSSKNLYDSSFDEYKRFAALGAEPVSELVQGFDLSLARIFNQHFRKIYMPVTSVCKGNVFAITSLPGKNKLLLSSDMSDSDHIVSVIEGSDLSDGNGSSELALQELVIKQFRDRGYIKVGDSTADKPNTSISRKRKIKPSESTVHRLDAGVIEVPTRAKKERSTSANKVKKARFNSDLGKYEPTTPKVETVAEIREAHQSHFTHYSEYAREMIIYIQEVGSKPFSVEDLEDWAKEQGFNPNKGEIEVRVLREAMRKGIVKRINEPIDKKQVATKWILLNK